MADPAAAAPLHLVGVLPAAARPLLTEGSDPAAGQLTWIEANGLAAALLPADLAPSLTLTWQRSVSRLAPLLPVLRGQVDSATSAAAWLEREAAALHWLLEDVAGRSEWIVRAYRDPTLPAVPLPEDAEAGSLAEWVWQRLRLPAEDLCPLPLEPGELPEGQMLHGALLIPDQPTERWPGHLAQVQAEVAAVGVRITATGPDPVWHFCPLVVS
ncbi:MAG TPA: hypothetical protein PKD86_04740 [Gemmatales bacterium]|nr:hypothetical protein [Gemmatales bacterium]HMP58639.1 hypothetical protein [Gemmatales bacterium]